MDNSAAAETIIAADVEITGTIKTSGSVQFNGKLEGDLQSEGDTVIGKSATVKGNLTVNSVSIAGTINGNITARDRIQMLSTAKVHGDIKAKRLTVEDGVTFIGRSEVNPTGQAAGAGSTPPSFAPSSGSKLGDVGGDPKGSLFGKK